jgi:hypothetical protein
MIEASKTMLHGPSGRMEAPFALRLLFYFE